ncbi:MAG: hypothetical protein LBB43_03905 [Spirochaetaceae bacterium]|jgi:hypothetical protein|nr:hypothetical protein [Spirochaetaceae bacterium]
MYSYATTLDKVATGKAVPEEYRDCAERLFPRNGVSGRQSLKEAGMAFADLLGIGNDYARLYSASGNEKEASIERLLEHFQNNISLLIQKTWVEKVDEERKENLQDRIPGLIELIEQNSYQKAVAEFGVILEELAYLFFGAQSRKDDFTEYTFRIDDQIGLFWWYGSQIAHMREDMVMDDESLRAILLIGLCYLTNF